MAEIWLTAEELEKRKERLENMKTAGRSEVAEELKFARSLGDLSENAEYDAAKDKQAKLEYDITQLEEELKNARIIDEGATDTKTVSIGATVDIAFMEGTKQVDTATYRIVGSAEADPFNNLISNESPIGKALLGKKARETAEVVTPGGVQKIKVLKITR